MNRYIAIFVLFVSGCASVPQNLQVDDRQTLVSYQNVVIDSQVQQGKIALWGGMIASVENVADATVIEIAYFPLNAVSRPILSDESLGRFRVNVNGFLDPLVYTAGRSISVLGQVELTQEGTVGEQKYYFPTLSADQIHLWKKRTSQTVTQIDVFPFGRSFGWHFWPYYRHSGISPYRTRVITRNRDYRRGTSVSKPTKKSNSDASKPARSRTFSSIPDREYRPTQKAEK
jgi:outer membrane lipoprotein